jgi:hypothetical protein
MVAVGCDDPTTVQPVVTGQVALFDELGTLLPFADQVQVAALSPSSIRTVETVTDEQGRFELELPDAEVGPLLFSRDGFGDMFRFDVGTETESIHVDLFAHSSAAVTGVDAQAESCGTFNCLRLGLDMSTDPEVSYLDYLFTNLLVVPNDQNGLIKTGSDATFELDGLHGILGSFPTGKEVYLVIHGATENLTSSYLAPDNGLEIFTDLSRVSAGTSFIIP